MPYCDDNDVRMLAPQIPSGADLTPYIEKAGGIVDAELRSIFEVPLWGGVLNNVDQVVRLAAAKIAAGTYLIAKYSAHDREPSGFAERLIGEGQKAIKEFRDNPSMLSADVAVRSASDAQKSGVVVVGDDMPPAFNMGDPATWGRQ